MQDASLVPLMGQAADWRTAMDDHHDEFPATQSVASHFGIRTDRYKLMHDYSHEKRSELDQWGIF